MSYDYTQEDWAKYHNIQQADYAYKKRLVAEYAHVQRLLSPDGITYKRESDREETFISEDYVIWYEESFNILTPRRNYAKIDIRTALNMGFKIIET